VNSGIVRFVVGCTLLAVLPGCFEAKKYDTKIRSITFPPLDSPVQYTDAPKGKFEEGGPAVSDEFHGCSKENVFDTRLKVGQKFVETWVYPSEKFSIGSITTRVIKSVSHNVIEIQISTNYGSGVGSERTEICELKPVITGSSNLYTQCRDPNAKETTYTPPPPIDPNKEVCEYQNTKEVSRVVTHGTYAFANGTKVPASKGVIVETSDYMCGKGQEPKVSKGVATKTKILILAKNVLKIDRISCRLVTVFNYSSIKGPEGPVVGSLSEIVEAPVAQ
jgi:hypothetical protein